VRHTVEDVRRWRGLAADLREYAKEIKSSSGQNEMLSEAERLERLANEVEEQLQNASSERQSDT
jgi:hypothetical protein